MISHYLKLSLRNQLKNKFFSVTNILGLGIAVSLLIINYVSFQFSFDKQHTKHDRIYRVESKFYEGDRLTDDWATSSFGYGSAVSSEMTSVEDYVRIGIQNTRQTVVYKEKRNLEDGIAYTGSSFFKVFDYKLIEGVKEEQLIRPKTVVITKKIANRYFNGEDPIGKIMTFATRSKFDNFEVTGVLEDFPENSHIKFDFLLSYASLPKWMKEFWYLHETYTYLLLAPGKDTKEIERQFPVMAEKYKTDDAMKDKKWAVQLVPLDQIHLNPQKQYERETKGNRHSLITLLIIAGVILLIAWINYVNLTTTRSLDRAKDVGIRKVSGACRFQLISQHLSEVWVINVLAIILAFILILLLRPVFNSIVGEDVGLYIFKLPVFWMSTCAFLLLGIVLSGFYPAFVMSNVKPSSILKGNYSKSKSAVILRKVLVVFQFSAALFLICGVFIVYKQVSFMQGQNLGVNIEKTIVINYPVCRDKLNDQVRLFAENLRNETWVSSVSLTGAVPGMEVAKFASNRLQGDELSKSQLCEMLTVDDQFVSAFGLDLIAGQAFRVDYWNEKKKILINEAAMTTLGIGKAEDAIGRKVLLEGQDSPVSVIGVVKNWHQRGLGNAHTPIMILANGTLGWVRPNYVAVKFTSNNFEESLNKVSTLWNSYFPESGFEYFFLDQFFDKQYKSDKRFGNIVGVFTCLAFFISILGLWALTAFETSKKVKEMGVRKVLGANSRHIIYLFTKKKIMLVSIALFIAVPISILIMNNWLLNYAFRINISGWVYAIGGIITLLVALFTVTWQSWKAATKNPVEALRYE